jgi:hypothetical protein
MKQQREHLSIEEKEILRIKTKVAMSDCWEQFSYQLKEDNQRKNSTAMKQQREHLSVEE